jgi:hypothetical protein
MRGLIPDNWICKDCGNIINPQNMQDEQSHQLNCSRFTKAKQQRYFGIIPYVPAPETAL